jgi:iron complex transport system substrate-binding protein
MLLVTTVVSCTIGTSSISENLATTTSVITLTDGLGRNIVLSAPAKKIVSMAPSATEILYSVGAGNQVIGRDTFSNYPDAVKSVQDVGGSMGSYSYEMITSLHPDLVIAAEINTPEQVKALEDLGLTVYYISNPKDFNGLYQLLKDVGILTGHSSQAEELVVSLQTRVNKVVEKVANTQIRPLVFYELDGTDPSKPWTPGPGSYMDMLIQMAGGVNVGSSLSNSWAQISVEELLAKDPQIILLGDSIYGMTPEQVSTRVGWDKLQAVKSQNIFGFNDDLVSRPGPRLVDGLEELVKLIHPELH